MRNFMNAINYADSHFQYGVIKKKIKIYVDNFCVRSLKKKQPLLSPNPFLN